jgi:glucokinase
MYLGIEIGGTKLQLGIGPGDGTLHALWRGAVVPADGADGIRRQIEQAIPELLASAQRKRDELQGVGIGFGGPVDDATRTVIKSHQIHGWDGFPLAQWIEDMLGLPAALGNDADVAGLAEALFGAGKGLSPIFYITIGSGIGGGLIINGENYRGCGRGAAEIGHIRIKCWGADEEVDEYVPLEQVASGWGIGEISTRFARANSRVSAKPSLLFAQAENAASLTAEQVRQAAEQGDAVAVGILSFSWEQLAEGISQILALLCPRRIVIGGGVSLMGEKLLFEPLRQKVAERVFKPFADCYDIVPAELGEEVVVHGALALAKKRLAQ